jgi:hypothetical protein
MATPAPPIEIITRSKRYPPANRCIYCDRKSVKRTVEHIIPFGLAANSLTIGAASCKRCQEKIKTFETHCLRHMWWPFRTQIGVPSRGKETPENFRLRKARITEVHPDGSIEYKKLSVTPLPPNEFPLYYVAYRFPSPGVLIGRDPAIPISFEAWVAHSEERVLAHIQDREAVNLGPGEPGPFLALLAKMAHGFAVAELGANAFHPVLRECIRGHTPPSGHWVGGDPENPPWSRHFTRSAFISSMLTQPATWSLPSASFVSLALPNIELWSALSQVRPINSRSQNRRFIQLR